MFGGLDAGHVDVPDSEPGKHPSRQGIEVAIVIDDSRVDDRHVLATVLPDQVRPMVPVPHDVTLERVRSVQGVAFQSERPAERLRHDCRQGLTTTCRRGLGLAHELGR